LKLMEEALHDPEAKYDRLFPILRSVLSVLTA